MLITDLNALADEDLVARIQTLCGRERQLLARIITYLAEVEDRQIHLKLSFSSMFEFCQRHLEMSESQAFRRIAATRLVRRFPSLIDRIERGDIHLSALVLLREHLTKENYEELITAASRKTKRRVEELIAARFPRPDAPSMIRKLPSVNEFPTPSATLGILATACMSSTELPHVPAANLNLNGRIKPLSETRFKVQLTVSKETRDKLERAVQLMRHKNPGGDYSVVVDRALDLLVAKLENEKLGKTARPQKKTRAAKPAHVRRSARREVFKREGEQCSFTGTNGRCQSRTLLEIDHVHPRALGGNGSAENIRVLCAAHNRLEAERAFGREHVARQIDLRREKSATTALEATTKPPSSVEAEPTLEASLPVTHEKTAPCVDGVLSRENLAAPDASTGWRARFERFLESALPSE